MTDLKSIPYHSPNIVTRKTGTEYVLVPIANNIADMNSVFTLNETGAFIWELIDGKRNLEEIINRVTEEYEVDAESASKDVLSFVKEMSNYLIINS
ncbi:MAG: PqqD family protein [Bacteroidota bacterium]|nr:PqqD family protein [Bacteroidota bacterium]